MDPTQQQVDPTLLVQDVIDQVAPSLTVDPEPLTEAASSPADETAPPPPPTTTTASVEAPAELSASDPLPVSEDHSLIPPPSSIVTNQKTGDDADLDEEEADMLQQLLLARVEPDMDMFQLPDELDADMLEQVARRSIEERRDSTGGIFGKSSRKAARDTDAASSVATSTTHPVYMHELFGRLFHTTNSAAADASAGGLLPNESEVVDPSLLDTRGILRALYGADINESNVELNKNAALSFLERVLESKKRDQETEELAKLFGSHASWNPPEMYEKFGILNATATPIAQPIANHVEDPNSTLVLAKMPTIFPNRQILHMDPTPYDPRQNDPSLIPVTTDRRVYTPSNIVRWCIDRKNNVALSNARLVRWNNGSFTLIVGSEIYELRGSTENALTMLATPAEVRKAGTSVKGVTGAVQFDEVLHIRQQQADSISDILVTEGITNRTMPVERRLGLHSGRTLPVVDLKKPRGEQDDLEQYIAREREARRKEMAQLAKEGRPMSLGEQLKREQTMMRTVQEASSFGELHRLQESQQARASSANAGRRSGGSNSRFSRDPFVMTDSHTNDATYTEDEVMQEADRVLRDMMARGDNDFLTNGSKRPRDEEELVSSLRPAPARHTSSFAACLEALRTLGQSLPQTSLCYPAVEETIRLLEGSSEHAWQSRQRDVRRLLEEVREEFPTADTSGVELTLPNETTLMTD